MRRVGVKAETVPVSGCVAPERVRARALSAHCHRSVTGWR